MLKVIELFAGVGSQTQALKNINIDYEIVGISEWSINSIISYGTLHTDNKEYDLSKTEILEELKDNTFSLNTKIPYDISKLNDKRLKLLYQNHKNSKNLGSVSDIKIEDITDCDLITYSFPCQDISLAGKKKGLFEGKSSSLLWEVGRVLDGLSSEDRLPKFLLMENVKALTNKTHEPGYTLWKDKLKDLGYYNYQVILNSLDFGIPQNRERVFLISSMEKLNIDINGFDLEYTLKDFTVDTEEYNGGFDVLDKTIITTDSFKYVKNTANYRSDSMTYLPVSNAPTLRTNGIVYVYIDEEIKKLGWKSMWKLMGFDDDSISKVALINQQTELKKQAGNSIVVNVLESIFKSMFIDHVPTSGIASQNS